jgi:uncharacterized membrane protein YhaH (DUF805 family)
MFTNRRKRGISKVKFSTTKFTKDFSQRTQRREYQRFLFCVLCGFFVFFVVKHSFKTAFYHSSGNEKPPSFPPKGGGLTIAVSTLFFLRTFSQRDAPILIGASGVKNPERHELYKYDSY